MMFSKRLYYGLLAIGLAALFYVSTHTEQVTILQKIIPAREPAKATTSKSEKFNADTALENVSVDRKKAFLRELLVESKNMAKIDENSKETETRLKTRAEALTLSEIEILREMSLNEKVSSDERFLAVYLLGYTPNPVAQKALWNVAKAPVAGDMKPDSILYHQELVLRAQALLGLNRQLPEAQRKSQMSAYAESQRELFLSRLAYRLTREPAKAGIGP